MRSHASYCFSMMRSNVLDALVAMGKPPADFSMSPHTPIGLRLSSGTSPRAVSEVNFVTQGKVTGGF